MGKNGVKFQEIFQSNQVESRNFEENDDGEFLIDLDGLGKGKKKNPVHPERFEKDEELQKWTKCFGNVPKK